jgi:hypothetical protein
MSIQTNFPAIKPTLLLDFANTKQLDSRITFTRASTATYYGTQTAKAEENLLLQSQDFATTWANTGTTDTANTSVAPDGTTTADTLTEDPSGTGQASIAQSTTFTAGLPYTFSFFVKQGTQTFAQLLFPNVAFGVNAYANFNVTTGAGAVGTVGSSTTASIVDAGNGWYRCIITATATTTASSTGQLYIIESATDARAPSITLDSGTILLWGAQLEQRSAVTAYTPTTTQAITNYVPQLLTAASGVARFDHNPTTLESLGLLIEESRTNLVTYSSEFDNAAWTKTATTITANTIVAPDGTLSGDLSVADTSSALHAVRATYTGTTTTTYSYSVYAKQASGSYEFVIHFGASSGTPTWSSGNRATVRFNLLTGVVVNTGSGVGNSTVISSSITPVGNGWYRCTFVFIPDTTGVSTSFTVGQIAAPTSQSVATAWTGDGYSGAYIWGAQLEAGAFPTSYIPTVASQVTRAVDAASMTGTNFSSWYNQAEGTLYADASPQASNALGYALFEVNDATATNRIGLFKLVTTGNASIAVRTGDVTQAGTNNGAWTSSGKLAGAYAVNNFASVLNGGVASTDTSGTLPLVTQAIFGARGDGANRLTGTIRKIAYYPLRVTNAQLQGLTS